MRPPSLGPHIRLGEYSVDGVNILLVLDHEEKLSP